MNNLSSIQFLTGLARASQAVMQKLTTALLAAGPGHYGEIAEAHRNYMVQMSFVWIDTIMHRAPAASNLATKKADPRFAGDAWKNSRYHDFLKQVYLVNARHVNELIELTQVDDRTRARLGFFARQVLDALSPSNYLATNPQAVQRAIETRGDSLAAGVQNLLADIGKGRITMSDEEAFEVGENLAVTPGAVVFENEMMQLIQYRPLTEEVGARPLVIIPPAINKFYVLDLQPSNSFVRYAVERGNTVFMVSWRNVSADQGHWTWDDYLALGVECALDVALAITGADRANALGYCVGGTMLGCAAAVLAARGEDKIASLTFLATMLDFCDPGEIGLFIDEASVSARERTVGGGGIVPGHELAFAFSTLRGNDLIWPYVVGNYLEGRQPDAFDILYWNADSTNLPGPMYCWYVRNTYLENNISVPGKTRQCGIPVDLIHISVPTYVLASHDDHIVPWRTAYMTASLVSGPVRFALAASGHIAGVINPAWRNKRSFWIEGEIGGRPERWLESAREVPGSWWGDWNTWLRAQTSQLVPARARLGNRKFGEIEPAPGRYVKTRIRPR
jgi:polyhydroxyalkanoate synthase